ncbi:hypothetical protein BJY01DRAFT_247889 [Aspergillus pseudoustus]|uniref:BAH domain-containing protein n=1 Tax=Aspergillus pseudoustus TaxID=1810923 RepID=A0ABR4JZ62_9EURO
MPWTTTTADPPTAKLLYKEEGEGWSLFSPMALNGARPWNHLMRVQSANLETATSKPWKIHVGDIVTVCVPGNMDNPGPPIILIEDSEDEPDPNEGEDPDDDPKAYAKVADLRCLGDGRYMAVYAWLYTREEIAAELKTRTGGVVEKTDLAMLRKKWPRRATFRYMLSTNRTVTLWNTAITRAPPSVVSSICGSSVYVTRRLERYIADIDDERLEWMRGIFHMKHVPDRA